MSENQYVKMGAFHTLDLEANRDVRIEKEEGGWDSIALSRVNDSCIPDRGAEVAAVVCGEGILLALSMLPEFTVRIGQGRQRFVYSLNI